LRLGIELAEIRLNMFSVKRPFGQRYTRTLLFTALEPAPAIQPEITDEHALVKQADILLVSIRDYV